MLGRRFSRHEQLEYIVYGIDMLKVYDIQGIVISEDASATRACRRAEKCSLLKISFSR